MAKDRKLVNKILFFILIGLVPGLFLYVFSKGDQVFEAPPYYGAIPISENGELTGDTVYHTIPNFSFTTPQGKKELEDYKDKIIVATVLGKACPEDCEIHVEGFSRLLLKEIGDNNNYDDVVVLTEFVSYDTDEKPDFNQLDRFFKDNYNFDNWILLHTDKNKLYDFKASPNKPNLLRTSLAGQRNGHAYYNFAILIDKNRHIRGIHNIKSSSSHIRDLLDDIKMLKKEEDYENK